MLRTCDQCQKEFRGRKSARSLSAHISRAHKGNSSAAPRKGAKEQNMHFLLERTKIYNSIIEAYIDGYLKGCQDARASAKYETH